MGLGSEPCHIVDKAEHRHIDLRLAEHGYTFSCVGKRHLLGCGYNDSTGQTEGLHKGEMYIARTRRHVDEEVVELAPVGLLYELFESVRGHSTTPDSRAVGVDEETYRKHFHAVGLRWNYKVAAVYLVHIQLCAFKAEHLGKRRTEDIGVEDTDTISLSGKRHCKVGGNGAFAYTAFTRRYCYYIFHAGKHRWLWRCDFAFAHGCVDGDFGGRLAEFYGCLGCLEH